jgi:hypothetical protein
VLVLADRGSVLQVVVAACLSLGFIVLHQSLWPYKLSADNVFKAAVEIQIFLTILAALVLKTDLRAEAVRRRPAARILSPQTRLVYVGSSKHVFAVSAAIAHSFCRRL